MRWLIYLAFLIPLPGQAQQPDVISGLIASLESGVICAPPSAGRRIAPGTIEGETNIIDVDPPFVSRANKVPAVLGLGFGVKSAATLPEGLSDVLMTVTHPPLGPDAITEQMFFTTISGGNQSVTFYQFDHDYELALGLWRMEATFGDQVLYRVSFEVVAPSAIPELAQICGFEELLS